MGVEIRRSGIADLVGIHGLYQRAVDTPDGLIRRKDEIDHAYIEGFLKQSMESGLSLVALHADDVVGEIHAYTPPIFAFQHLLTDLTIVVDPDHQGQGIGSRLFSQFLNTVKFEMPDISRIELYTREHNLRNVKFYERMGFVNEGRQQNKIFVSTGQFETPLHMAWLRGASANEDPSKVK